jgi:hypothetical protein
MKTNLSRFRPMAVVFAAIITLAATASAAPSGVTAQLEPGEIALGESAQLTITVSGSGNEAISPPTVPGLEFVDVGQSSQMQSINGMTSSTTSEIYQVIPQHAGKFTIPALSRGAQPILFQVRPGNGNNGAGAGNNSGTSSLPPPAMSGSSAGETRVTQDGSTFARLRLPKRELYVGETVPVDIQVGFRPGLVKSLDGLPTLNGDAFMLNKLSAQPEQAQEMIGGQPYTVLTWHSALTAVKPGDFALNIETPLTVQIRTTPSRRARMPQGFPDDSMFDDLLNDPFFQGAFGGGTTEKEITVASEPDKFKVLALPAEGRPAGFSGAVGKYDISAELSAATAAAGDPLTLRLKVTGTGNFDRVSSAMLGKVDGWKTYQASAKFQPADSVGCSGEKDFEQAVIPMQPGRQSVPALAFSFFNPETKRYETKLTAPLSVEVSPAAAGGLPAAGPAATPGPPPANETPRDGLRPDHVVTGSTVATLRPLYFQRWFLGSQSVLVLCFVGGLIFLRRRELRANDVDGARRREALEAVVSCLDEMDAASMAGDAARFFQSARAAMQQKLAASWHVAPASITIAEIDARLNGEGGEIRRVFALADQAAYSGQRLSTADFQQWKEIVFNQIQHTEAL